MHARGRNEEVDLDPSSNLDAAVVLTERSSATLTRCVQLPRNGRSSRRALLFMAASYRDAGRRDELDQVESELRSKGWAVKLADPGSFVERQPTPIEDLMHAFSGVRPTREEAIPGEFVLINERSLARFPDPESQAIAHRRNPNYLPIEVSMSIDRAQTALHHTAFGVAWATRDAALVQRALTTLSRDSVFGAPFEVAGLEGGLLFEQKLPGAQTINTYLAKLGFNAEKHYSSDIVRVEPEDWSDLIAALQRDPGWMYQMSPKRFEELIAELLACQGWQTRVIGGANDRGIDILAHRRDTSGRNVMCLVQCKRNSRERPVQPRVIRELYGSVHIEGADAGLVVTSSFFSDAVLGASWYRPLIDLAEYRDIVEWLGEYS
jgi:hypothetical protein